MPTYLTPGVYVEEVPSANKPIEGVSTSIAAFVGLAPGGPVNTPMRISNWTQFVKIFGDPSEPDNGPFMEGAYLAHAVYGFFQNGGSLCWVVRVGNENDAPTPRAMLPSAQDRNVEALRVVARKGIDGPIVVELSEEPAAGGGEGNKEPGDPSYKVVVTAGSEREEHAGLTLKKGRTHIATRLSSASKLVTVEELPNAAPDMRIAEGRYTLSTPAAAQDSVQPAQFEGDVAKRTGMGGVVAAD